MRHIHRTTTEEILSQLPELTRVSDGTCQPIEAEVLVCSGGFEERAAAIVKQAARLKVRKVLLVRYPTFHQETEKTVKAFQSLVPNDAFFQLSYDRAHYRRGLRAQLAAAVNGGPAPRILVDISGMSSYVFFQTMSTITSHFPHARLSLFYAEADTYFPLKKDWEEFRSEALKIGNPDDRARHYEKTGFQSVGVDSAYESEAFPGRNPDALPTQPIVIPNFSLERAKAMLTRIESLYNASRDDAVWLLGQPPDKEKNGWRLDAMAELCNVLKGGTAVDTLNYKDLIRVLDDLWDKFYARKHLVVATAGSKMQHVGTFLFLMMHPEVGLVLSEPTRFKWDRFSEGVGPCWYADFGEIKQLLALLSARGTLSFRWAEPA